MSFLFPDADLFKQPVQALANLLMLAAQLDILCLEDLFFPTQARHLNPLPSPPHLATQGMIIEYHIFDLAQERFDPRFPHAYPRLQYENECTKGAKHLQLDQTQ